MLHSTSLFAGFDSGGKLFSPVSQRPCNKRFNTVAALRGSAVEWAQQQLWHDGVMKEITSAVSVRVLSPPMEPAFCILQLRNQFVKNTISFPLKYSLLLQLVFYFVRRAPGFLMNSLSTMVTEREVENKPTGWKEIPTHCLLFLG